MLPIPKKRSGTSLPREAKRQRREAQEDDAKRQEAQVVGSSVGSTDDAKQQEAQTDGAKQHEVEVSSVEDEAKEHDKAAQVSPASDHESAASSHQVSKFIN